LVLTCLLVVSNCSQEKGRLIGFRPFSLNICDGEKNISAGNNERLCKKYPLGSHLWPLLSTAAKKSGKGEKAFDIFFICLLIEWSFRKKKFIKFYLNSKFEYRITIPKGLRLEGKEKVLCFKCQSKGLKPFNDNINVKSVSC